GRPRVGGRGGAGGGGGPGGRAGDVRRGPARGGRRPGRGPPGAGASRTAGPALHRIPAMSSRANVGPASSGAAPTARTPTALTPRGRAASALARLATRASRLTGRGSGGMIGGLVALKVDPGLMRQLAAGRRSVLVTGTNGKSTTTRMAAAALGTVDAVATNANGDNMDAGIVSALNADRDAPLAAIEVDELHTPDVAVN